VYGAGVGVTAIDVTYFCDPGSPWGYAASPQLALLRYRYGEELRFRLVVVGLWETSAEREAIGYERVGTAQGSRLFRRFGMPFSTAPRPRVLGSGRPCRAVVAARLRQPGREHDVLRALQFAYFTTSLMVDTDDGIAEALEAVAELDAGAIVGALDDPDVAEAYTADRGEARTAAGSPSEFIGSAVPDAGGEAVRYTPPTLIFEQGSNRLEVGGYQPLESYEVAIAHIDRALERRWSASDPVDALERVGYPLTTFEIATCMAEPRLPPDPGPVEDALVALEAEGRVTRTERGADAVWALVRNAP
jgi:protein-disulfide isomerase-like protein with CxxC motif